MQYTTNKRGTPTKIKGVKNVALNCLSFLRHLSAIFLLRMLPLLLVTIFLIIFCSAFLVIKGGSLLIGNIWVSMKRAKKLKTN